MKSFLLCTIILAVGTALAQIQPGGVPPAQSQPRATSPAQSAPQTTAAPGTVGPATATPSAPASPVGALPNATTINGAGTTINTVSGPCNPNVPVIPPALSASGTTTPLSPAPLSATGTSVPTTGVPAVGVTTVIGNTNLNTPGPAAGTTTVAQPCVFSNPLVVPPVATPSPTP